MNHLFLRHYHHFEFSSSTTPFTSPSTTSLFSIENISHVVPALSPSHSPIHHHNSILVRAYSRQIHPIYNYEWHYNIFKDETLILVCFIFECCASFWIPEVFLLRRKFAFVIHRNNSYLHYVRISFLRFLWTRCFFAFIILNKQTITNLSYAITLKQQVCHDCT